MTVTVTLTLTQRFLGFHSLFHIIRKNARVHYRTWVYHHVQAARDETVTTAVVAVVAVAVCCHALDPWTAVMPEVQQYICRLCRNTEHERTTNTQRPHTDPHQTNSKAVFFSTKSTAATGDSSNAGRHVCGKMSTTSSLQSCIPSRVIVLQE